MYLCQPDCPPSRDCFRMGFKGVAEGLQKQCCHSIGRSKQLPLGEAGSAKPRLMRVGEHFRFALQFQQNRHCSPALIRLLRFAPHPPSPRGRHGPAAAGNNPSGAARQLPLHKGALGVRRKKPPLCKGRWTGGAGTEGLLSRFHCTVRSGAANGFPWGKLARRSRD